MFKPLFLAAILAATVLPAVQQAHAEGLSIDLMPGVSLRIGDQDNRGRYWDGYDWRDRDWWQGHQGRYLGDRSPRGYTGTAIAGAIATIGANTTTLAMAVITSATAVATSITGRKRKSTTTITITDRWRRHGDDDRD